MIDNEIIKALKCCLNVDSKCADCHFLFEKHFCKNALLKQILDRINRQNAEIRQLRVKLDDYERDIVPKLKYSLERANKYGSETDAENIRLLKENENLTSDLTSAKAEIERLKKENLELEIEKFKCNTKVGTLTGRITLMERDIPFIKAEATKDFAERLKVLINPDWCKIHQQIDNLAKEMIGEQEWVHLINE